MNKIIAAVNHFRKSFRNFFKSSFLSLVIILIILLLLTQMDQALTMLVDLVENPHAKTSLFLSFLFINGLAIALSHFPIYTYYAANLNNSENYTNWKKVYPIKFWPFRKFHIFIFTTNKNIGYTPDNWANYFRYFTGFLIHCVWIHYIISSFTPNLIFENFPLETVKIIIYLLLLVPFVLYIVCKERFTKLTAKKDKDEQPLPPDVKKENGRLLTRLYKRLGLWYFVIALSSILLLVLTLTIGNFSPGGFVLILLTSYLLIFNYVFFRLLRTKFTRIKRTLTSPLLIPVNLFISWIGFLERSRNYLAMFILNFIVSVVLLSYATIASIHDWNLYNGIPILLAFFYFYYYIIANLGKYFFVAKREKLFNTNKYRILFFASFVILALLIITNCTGVESKTHQLDLVENSSLEIPERQFVDSLKVKNDNTLFFIASHGGGLKANVWTLNVINLLQEKTEGKLMNQTIAMSGASGGSLGMALYTGLFRELGTNTGIIQQRIDRLAHQNYTSIDLSLTFGLDTYRKIWPLNQNIGVRDRPYYAMMKYQNIVEARYNESLSLISFRDFWKDAFNKNGYFPALIMNTAGTQGSRGIFWSVKPNNFDDVFPFATNLADLNGNLTVPYYQAVSTTNRFPVFSPAAKIPGYGHFIDAGAIDNSGLLGCLDLHNYLLRDEQILGDKQIAYIEIINSKTLYVGYLIDKFKKKNGILHIPKNENETDNIVADLKTGLNLDKIPGYLSDYLTNWEKNSDGKIRYFKIFLPHKVSLDDIEGYMDGTIDDDEIRQLYEVFLKEENNIILNLTEKPEKTFFDPWQFYEPTLSRHLSKSSIRFFEAMLEHPLLLEQFSTIKDLIDTEAIEENINPEITF